ncbi:MAG: DUF1365 domain-containing protein [Planctomycetota bacterium]
MHSALYRGRMQHRRHSPKNHRFGYRMWMAYLDLDEVEGLGSASRLFSVEGRNVLAFRRRDYLGEADLPLSEAVRLRVGEVLGRRPEGSIRMLTQLRCLGYCFNPVTFYYCFDPDEQLDAVVAEITNTPWGERRAYVLDAAQALRDHGELRFAFDKDFHVSPFFGMDHRYEWSFSEPSGSLEVSMRNLRAGEVVFDASMQLERRAFDRNGLRACLVRHPFMTGKVIAAIHWQALRLWLKRVPVHLHPRRLAEVGAESSEP